MALTGKTGADAIAKDQKHQCLVLRKYQAKYTAVIAAALAASAINSTQATLLTAWVSQSVDYCTAMVALAEYSGFSS